MGSRGPLSKRSARGTRTASGVRLRAMPDDRDAIERRLFRDIPNVTPADVPLVQDMAMWIEIRQDARQQMLAQPAADMPADRRFDLLTTDTTHGNGEEARKSPLLIVLRTASEQLRADAAQLGASVAARARLPQTEYEQQSLADILFADVPREI